jgi:UDP-glucose 4-epimerase
MATLITGGSGLIGASLTRMMVEAGEPAVVIDIAPVHPISKKWESHFAHFQGSVDNLPELLNIIKKKSIGTIFYLGVMLSMPSEKKPREPVEKRLKVVSTLKPELFSRSNAHN